MGETESAQIGAPAPDTYVLRLINYASTTPTYALKATLFDSTVVSSSTVPGQVENWTMTCEKDGKVLQTASVVVNRGQQAKVNWSECARRW